MPRTEVNQIFAGRTFQYTAGKRLFYTLLPILFVGLFGVYIFRASQLLNSRLFDFLFLVMFGFGLGASLFRALFVRRVFRVEKESLSITGPGFNHIFHWKDIVELVRAEGYSGQRNFYLLRVRQNMLFFQAVRAYNVFDDELQENDDLAQAISERLTPPEPGTQEEINEPSNIGYVFPLLALLSLTPFAIFILAWLFTSGETAARYHYFSCMWFYFVMLLMIHFEDATCGMLRKQTDHRLGLLMVFYGLVGLLIYFSFVTQILTLTNTHAQVGFVEKAYLLIVLLIMALLSFKQMLRGVGKLLDKSQMSPVFEEQYPAALGASTGGKYIFKSRQKSDTKVVEQPAPQSDSQPEVDVSTKAIMDNDADENSLEDVRMPIDSNEASCEDLPDDEPEDEDQHKGPGGLFKER